MCKDNGARVGTRPQAEEAGKSLSVRSNPIYVSNSPLAVEQIRAEEQYALHENWTRATWPLGPGPALALP